MAHPEALVAAVDDLTRSSTHPDQVGAGLCDLVVRWVPFDFACFATLDPATSLITGTVKTAELGDTDEVFAHYEYAIDDVNQFAEIATRPVPTGILHDDTGGRPEVSARYREFLLPRFDFGHELRVSFRSRDRSWGALSLHRTSDGRGFRPEDAAVLAAVGDSVALGIRRSLFASVPADSVDASRPAVVVVDADNQVVQRTAAVDAVFDEIEPVRDSVVPTQVLSVAAAVRARPEQAPATVRVKTRSGHWLVLQGSPLLGSGDRDDVVVVVEPASPRHLTPLALETYGLTNREQEVAQLVLQGLDTRGISGALHLSPHTVQDHLKAIFAKAGVGSRRELIAGAFFDHHAPHLGGALHSDGSPVRG